MKILAAITRRTALLSAAAAGCATAPASGPADEMFINAATPSESVHSGVASEDGEHRLTVRLCRYPDLGLAWVWMHARTPEGFFSYVDHLSPCSHDATAVDGSAASYSDLNHTLAFRRNGPVLAPTSATASGSARAWRCAQSRFGAGAHQLDFSIAFSPARLYSGLNAGRTEVFGRSRATLTISGKTLEIEGPAQFHEQRQSTPRFTQPFAYSTLWARDAASTLLIAPKRRDGYLLEGAKSTEVEDVRMDPPAALRKIAIRLADGRMLEGRGEVVEAYTIPIAGNIWRGHMVRVQLGGRTYAGHMNDYLSDSVPYAG